MKPFKNILYVTEGTVDQASAIERAVSLAESNQSKLTIIDVIPPVAEDYREDTMTCHMSVLESLIEPHRNRLKIDFDIGAQLQSAPFPLAKPEKPDAPIAGLVR
jgi:nucleotide-binding universal stress UspA family protein